MSQNALPHWRGRAHHRRDQPPTKTKGGQKQQTQHTPTQQGHTRPTKNGVKQMASIFGTLLSSQGSGAHRIRPSGHPSGQLFELTRSASSVSTLLPGFPGRRFVTRPDREKTLPGSAGAFDQGPRGHGPTPRRQRCPSDGGLRDEGYRWAKRRPGQRASRDNEPSWTSLPGTT